MAPSAVTSPQLLTSGIWYSDSLELFTDTSALEGCKYSTGLLLVTERRILSYDWPRAAAALDGCNSSSVHSHTSGILSKFLSQFLKGICGENVSGIISQTKLGDYCKNTLSNCLKCHPVLWTSHFCNIFNIFPQQMLCEDLSLLFVKQWNTPPQILYYSKNVNQY